ncbi:MAG: hypothetical protein ACKV2U_22000 [Bryobacteraceae bacterium]
MHVRELFFKEHNISFHGASFGHGISTAIMNRSEAELEEIAIELAASNFLANALLGFRPKSDVHTTPENA